MIVQKYRTELSEASALPHVVGQLASWQHKSRQGRTNTMKRCALLDYSVLYMLLRLYCCREKVLDGFVASSLAVILR